MRLKVDEVSKFLIISIVISQYFLSNGFYLFVPAIITVILFYFLQQPYKCSVFTLLLLWHFLQIYTGGVLCNYLGKDIDFNTANRSTAIVLSSIGLIPLLAPIIYVQNKFPLQSRTTLTESVKVFSLQKVMYVYIAFYFISFFLGSIAFAFSGLTQILFWLVEVKWIFFLLFGYITILRNEKRGIFILFFLFEFISGFYSFFSDFKVVIFFVFILVISLLDRIDIQFFFKTILIGLCLIFFGVLWTSIKGEYRSFLNEGTKTQEVNVSSNDALDKIYTLSSETDVNTLEGSTAQFLDRLQYTFFFAKTIDRVPNVIPFQNGNNWLENLEFTTTPRYLNPDKPILDQSEKTKHYTGIPLAGKDKGTSFSLGYFAESYIDFGIQGMMVFLIVIGGAYAFFYNYLLKKSSRNTVFNYCVAASFFVGFTGYEMDGTFLLGRLLSGMLTYYLLITFFFPAIIKYLTDVKKEAA